MINHKESREHVLENGASPSSAYLRAAPLRMYKEPKQLIA